MPKSVDINQAKDIQAFLFNQRTKYGATYQINESATQQGLILPTYEIIGIDVTKLDHYFPEHPLKYNSGNEGDKTTNGRIDSVLAHAHSQEHKKLGTDLYQDQVRHQAHNYFRYFSVQREGLAVPQYSISDGQVLIIIDDTNTEFHVDLIDEKDYGKIAEQLNRLLDGLNFDGNLDSEDFIVKERPITLSYLRNISTGYSLRDALDNKTFRILFNFKTDIDDPDILRAVKYTQEKSNLPVAAIRFSNNDMDLIANAEDLMTVLIDWLNYWTFDDDEDQYLDFNSLIREPEFNGQAKGSGLLKEVINYYCRRGLSGATLDKSIDSVDEFEILIPNFNK